MRNLSLALIAAVLSAVATGCLDASSSRYSASSGTGSATRPVRTAHSPPVVAPSAPIAVKPVSTQELFGQVVGVSDGDTVTVLDATKTQHKIRLEGIDAPESHQAFGERCKQELSKRVFLKPVRIEVLGRDRY